MGQQLKTHIKTGWCNRWIRMAALALIPLLLFAVLAERKSWLPQRLEIGPYIHTLVFSPDGHYLAGGGNSVIRIWDVQSRRLMHTIETGKSCQAEWIAFSPDNKTLSSRCGWDVASGKPLQVNKRAGTASTREKRITSPDGAYVAVTTNRTTKLFDARSGKSLWEMTANVKLIGFSGDSKAVMLQFGRARVTLWDVNTGKRWLANSGSAVLTPDHETLITAWTPGNNGIGIWDVRTRQLLRTLPQEHRGWVSWLLLSADGRTLVAADQPGSVGFTTFQIWDVPSRRLTRTLL